MSKTERALTSDEVDTPEALDGLDVEEVETVDEVDSVDVGDGDRPDDVDELDGSGDLDEVDGETTAEIWAQVDEALDEYAAVEAATGNGAGPDESVDASGGVGVVDEPVEDDVSDVVDGSGGVDVAEESADASTVVDDEFVEDDVSGEVATVVDDDDDASAEPSDVAAEVEPAVVGEEFVEDDVSGEVATVVDADGDASAEPSDVAAEAEPAVVDEDGDATDAHRRDDVADDDLEDSSEADDEPYELPEIVPATPEPGEARDDRTDEDGEEVSEDILEELRRADIDGPIVEMAPQDDTTSQRRRPKRAPDYDPAPVPIPAQVPRVLGRKPRVRKVTRVVRHVDPWSVFKIAIVANLVLYLVLLTAGVLLWNVAHATGTVDNVERFFESFGWTTFEFNGGEIYHASWISGLFVVIGLTGFAVLLATLFNLITDLVGGVRLTVLEEEVVETRTSPMRRFVVRRAEPDVPVTLRDESGAMVREAVVDDSGAIKRPTR